MKSYFGKLLATTIKRKGTFALWVAIQHIGVRLCLLKNTLVGRGALVIQRHTEDGKERTLNEWHFSRQDDTLGRGVQMVVIPLRSGLNSRKNIIIAALFVVSIRNLLKTISYHCQKAGQIMSQIFNRFAETAIVKSGNIRLDYFNIYESKEQ